MKDLKEKLIDKEINEEQINEKIIDPQHKKYMELLKDVNVPNGIINILSYYKPTDYITIQRLSQIIYEIYNDIKKQ